MRRSKPYQIFLVHFSWHLLFETRWEQKLPQVSHYSHVPSWNVLLRHHAHYWPHFPNHAKEVHQSRQHIPRRQDHWLVQLLWLVPLRIGLSVLWTVSPGAPPRPEKRPFSWPRHHKTTPRPEKQPFSWPWQMTKMAFYKVGLTLLNRNELVLYLL